MTTDVERFERGDDSAYGGELLPDERYEEWTPSTRERLRERQLALLRSEEERWDDVLREDPADEAHRALMRRRGERRPAGRGAAVPRVARPALAARRPSPPRRRSRSSAKSRVALRCGRSGSFRAPVEA